MEFPFKYFSENYDYNKLEKLELDLTVEDCERFDEIGWKNYREGDYVKYLVPSLGEAICFHWNDKIVIEIKGKRYKFELHDNCMHEMWSCEGKSISLTPTEEPISEGVKNCGCRAFHLYHFFGQPRWVQSPCYPAYKGKPCYHLVTVENDWGDSGNWNIFISLDENDVPNAVFFESFCC